METEDTADWSGQSKHHPVYASSFSDECSRLRWSQRNAQVYLQTCTCASVPLGLFHRDFDWVLTDVAQRRRNLRRAAIQLIA